MVSRDCSSRKMRSLGTPAVPMRSAITAASLRAGGGPSPWLPDAMIAMLGRCRASCATARARAAVDALGVPSELIPPPTTTAISGNPARSPSLFTRGSDLVKRAVHDHDDREVVPAALLVDLVVEAWPAGGPSLVVDRVVVESLIDRNARKQLVEGLRDLLDRILLLRGVETRDRIVEHRVEVDRPTCVGLRERVLHAPAW